MASWEEVCRRKQALRIYSASCSQFKDARPQLPALCALLSPLWNNKSQETLFPCELPWSCVLEQKTNELLIKKPCREEESKEKEERHRRIMGREKKYACSHTQNLDVIKT